MIVLDIGQYIVGPTSGNHSSGPLYSIELDLFTGLKAIVSTVRFLANFQ